MRRATALVIAALLGAAGCTTRPAQPVAPRPTPVRPAPGPIAPEPPEPPPPYVWVEPPECRGGPDRYAEAAERNRLSSWMLEWAPFGREERGWLIYWPKVADEIGTPCSPASRLFAEALARWQSGRGLPADGVMTAGVFDVFKGLWQERRPFIRARLRDECPDPPPPEVLAQATREETLDDRPLLLRQEALAAYRQMTAAARTEAPELASEPYALGLFSGFRSPESDAARCERDGNCNGIVRARCSPHRTGLAIDLAVGALPGHTFDSTVDANRLFMTRTAAYRWLVANARRFGFEPYVFEPWHWEWVGGTQPAPAP